MSCKKRKLDEGKISVSSNSVQLPMDLGSNRVKTHVLKKMKQTISTMEDSIELYRKGDCLGLWNRFEKDGFVLLRGLLDAESIFKAKDEIQDNLVGMKLLSKDRQTALSSVGWTIDTATGTIISGTDDFSAQNGLEVRWKSIGQSGLLQNLFRSQETGGALSLLRNGFLESQKIAAKASIPAPLGVAVKNFHPQYSWLRVKAPLEYTQEHADIFYFKNFTGLFPPSVTKTGSKCEVCSETISKVSNYAVKESKRKQSCTQQSPPTNVVSCADCNGLLHLSCLAAYDNKDMKHGDRWHYCPRCQPGLVMGTCWIPLGDLAISDGVLAMMKSSTCMPGLNGNAMRGTQLPSQFFKNAVGKEWTIADYRAGDVVIFDIRAIHCSSKNYGSGYRLSLDSRWCFVPQGHQLEKVLLGSSSSDL